MPARRPRKLAHQQSEPLGQQPQQWPLMPQLQQQQQQQQQQHQQHQQRQLVQQLSPQFRAETPPVRVRDLADEAIVPISPSGSDLLETFAPQPRRALAGVSFFQLQQESAEAGASVATTAAGGAQVRPSERDHGLREPEPMHARTPGSPWNRGVGDDEASDEIRELLGSNGGKGGRLSIESSGRSSCGGGAIDTRPLSTVSTSAGPTPGIDDDRGTSPWLALDRYSTPTPEEQADRSGQGQNRKVFVGGVPQEMTQDDLYDIFSRHAGVKKAWLQRHHNKEGVVIAAYNHRGFGFVIFNEASAVDKLFGGPSFSKYITVQGGIRLEVKRARSSTDLANTSPALRQGTPLQQVPPRSGAPTPVLMPVAPWPQAQSPAPMLFGQMPSMPWIQGGTPLQALTPTMTPSNQQTMTAPQGLQMGQQPAAMLAAFQQLGLSPGPGPSMVPGLVSAAMAAQPAAGMQLAMAQMALAGMTAIAAAQQPQQPQQQQQQQLQQQQQQQQQQAMQALPTQWNVQAAAHGVPQWPFAAAQLAVASGGGGGCGGGGIAASSQLSAADLAFASHRQQGPSSAAASMLEQQAALMTKTPDEIVKMLRLAMPEQYDD
mmetsp:Transcript_5372/g.17537  ORF Transcript_5372/g.17537 Transcript_5372/m.17537 type:complete len:601 (+) Transcript_5372:96-1898(+)